MPPRAAAADPVVVFAAASTKTALDEAAGRYEADTGVTVSYAGSSALARQIQHGAPADVFVSASREWMDALQAQGLIDPGSRFDLVGNALVMIAHGEQSPVRLDPDFVRTLGDARLAMALVDAVPAGRYGKAALQHLGLWQGLARRIAQADNARAALALVARGETPFGIVYATDALAGRGVSVVASFPPGSHPPIVYPAAAVAGGNRASAAAFLAHLRGPASRQAFERQGFRFLPPETGD